MTDHTHTQAFTPVSAWDSDKTDPVYWGKHIGIVHAYHDFMADGTEMTLDERKKFYHAFMAGTGAWEYELPNPIEAWGDCYIAEDMPTDDEGIGLVRQWALAYYEGYTTTMLSHIDESITARTKEERIGA